MSEQNKIDPLAQAATEGALPSMTTDNTPLGRVEDATVESGPIASTVVGMQVLDAANDEIGKVREVRMGDPSAVTDRGERDTEVNTFWDDIVGALFGDNPDVGESTRHELIRTGFIEIDGKGWFGTDYVASAAQLGSVSGDVLKLNVNKDALIRI